MKGLRNILIQFAISFTVLWSVFVWYAAWNDVVNDGDTLTFTMWNDLVTQVGTISSAPFLKWYLDGLTIENDSGDTNNDILINVWTASSSDNTQYIDLGTAITKRLDASWTAWDNGWWLATGSKASNTWYHVFVIRKSDGSVDAWFDTSTTASNLLSTSGYNNYRRIGSVRTDGSSNIRGFNQQWNYFHFSTTIQDINVVGTTSRVFHTVSVPPVPVLAKMSITGEVTSAATRVAWITSPLEDDKVPNHPYPWHSSNSWNMKSRWDSYSISTSVLRDFIRTDNSTIGIRVNNNAMRFRGYVHGWTDLGL